MNKTVHKRLRTNGNYMHLMRNKMIGLCQYEKFIVPMWLFQHLSELNKSKQSELHAIHAHTVHRLPRDSFYVTIPRYKVHFFHFNGSPKNTYIENLPFSIEQYFMDTNCDGERDIGRVRDRAIEREKETEKDRKTPIQTENEERKHGIDFEQQFGFNCIYSINFIEAE